MNFVQLIVVYLALNLAPNHVDRLTIDTGEDLFLFTRQSTTAWNYQMEDGEGKAESVSINGQNMQVTHAGQTTINFMQQYVDVDPDADWQTIKTIPVKALKPPGTITIKRDRQSIRLRNKHDTHPFKAKIAWEKPTEE